ncbi:MAG: D-2-hydroxyacid dehydrogenase [Clostridiaceae bacterium]|jgi:phosphoglycerate dehydrogenase-like enzyme|nr:D-2-hydroxyacid dehydrogenase [Clostridiaceae bacterium]
MKNILVLLPVREEDKRLFEQIAPTANFTYAKAETVDNSVLLEANAIIGNPPPMKIRESKNLEWLQLQMAGIGEFAKENMLPDGAVLTNASGAFGLAISEYMLGVLLQLFYNLHIYRDKQIQADWSYSGQAQSIYNSTALVIGLGDIGGEFARRLKALGAYTIGIRRKDALKPDYMDELHLMDQLEALLPRADIVALSLPGTSLTNNIINKDTLRLMKKNAVLINVGRGNAVDTDALCDALEGGLIAGAALDVTAPEPLPKEHRLWKIKNAIITPHISGGFSLQETFERIVRISADNLEAYMSGKKLKNVVDTRAGY